MIYIALALIVLMAACILLHLRPLTVEEVSALSIKRRDKSVSSYYSHENSQYVFNKDAKKAMPPNGGYLTVDWKLSSTPPLAAALLKQKKHEWIIFGFEKNKTVNRLWMNKGLDRKSVSPAISIENVSGLCLNAGYQSVQIFHNHPNPEGFATGASQADLKSANSWAEILNKAGVGLVEYVCDRGRPIRYFLKVPDSFLPVAGFQDEIARQNGVSRFGNLSLHFERMF